MDNCLSKADLLVESIVRELRDPVIMSYLLSGDDYSYDNFPMKHLVDEKFFDDMVRYFLNQEGFLLDLFFKYHVSYEEFKLFEAKYMDTNYSKKEFFRILKRYIPIFDEPQDPLLPDTCSLETFRFKILTADPDFRKFRDLINNGLPLRLPGKKFAMYLNLLREYENLDYRKSHNLEHVSRIVPNKVNENDKNISDDMNPNRMVPNERVEMISDNELNKRKVYYYVKYYQKFFPKDYERYDKFQKEMLLPHITEEEYFDILSSCFH